MTRVLFIFLIVLGALWPLWAADNQAVSPVQPLRIDPLPLAAAARTTALAELALTRQVRLAERARILGEIQAGAAQVQQRRGEVLSLRQQVGELGSRVETLRTQRAQFAARESRRAEAALLAAGLTARPGMSLPDQVATAVAALEVRLTALIATSQVRVAMETVATRNGIPTLLPVLRLGGAQALALGPDANSRGLLQRAGEGNLALVVGPELRLGNEQVAIDPDARSLGLVVHTWTFSGWLAAGRLFIWPILAVLGIGGILGLLRLRALLRERRPDPVPLTWDSMSPPRPKSFPDQSTLLRQVAWRLRAADSTTREATLEAHLIGAETYLHRHLSLILVLAGIAPLLGLLGTVTGMIDLFATLSAGSDAKGISGAISEALVTTQAGMIAAIPLMLAHTLLHRLADRRFTALEADALAMLAVPQATLHQVAPKIAVEPGP